MMSTLFIGPKDKKFKLSDHAQLILGASVGVLLGVSLILLAFLFSRREKNQYESVIMNELKSKAID